MIRTMKTFVFAILLLAASTTSQKTIFNVKVDELLTQANLGRLKQVLAKDGAFVVSGLSEAYRGAVNALERTAPTCFNQLSLPEIQLVDGSKRATFGTNTNTYPDCIADSGLTIGSEFDSTFKIVAEALESLAGKKDSLSWIENGETSSPASSFSKLHHKDHIHVYEKTTTFTKTRKQSQSLEFHVDSGVLLMLTPSSNLPVQIKDIDGTMIDTSNVDDNAIIFIVARALPDWLLRGAAQSSQFFPAPHGVPSLDRIAARTVYARMMVAPGDSLPANPDTIQVPFRNIFLQDTVTKETELCPAEPSQIDCGEGMLYCWMSCLPVPECDNQEIFVCTNNVGETCCNDLYPAEGCLDMDGTCGWKCSSAL